MEIAKSLIVLITILRASVQIYVPDEGTIPKPQYSQGIQTWNYRRPNQIQIDHSYSKVHSHNNRSISTDSENGYADDASRRLYPIYNAHTYGARPQTGQSYNARPLSGQSQVYVINGTRIGRKSNAIRQIVAYNKEKRSPKIQIHNTCPTHATGQFVYEASCNQFLNCWKGRGYVQNCAPGTLFNPETLECDFPEKVTCVSGPRENVLQKERNANPQQIGCPHDFSGLIPNYTDCSKFINCVSGIENFMDCPTGTLFDMNKNICDFAHKATCFNGQNENLKRDVDNKLDFGTTRRSDQLRYKFGEIRCPEGVQDLVMHPTDCSKFLNCANGQTFVQDCAPGTLFNPVLKICDFPYNVRCEVAANSGSQNGNRNQGGTHVYESGYSQNHHGTHGSSANHGQGLENFGESGTNSYNQGSYGHNLPETYGTDGIGGSSSQHSMSGSSNVDRNRNTGGTYGHSSQDSHGTPYGTRPVGTTLTEGQNRNDYGTKGYGDSFSHSSWPSTQTNGNHQYVPGSKSTHGDGSWSGTQAHGAKAVSGTHGTQGSTFDGNTNHLNNQRVPVQNQYPDDDGVTANYDQVVHITHRVPYRNSYEPFFGTTQKTANDYDDYRPNHSQKFIRSTTPRILEKSWPPPFPSTDVNADYVFEYEDPDVNLEAENLDSGKNKDGDCAKVDFLCQNRKCVPKTLVCNGAKDCPDGRDEDNCLQYVSKFEVQKNKKLAILEKERWDNVSIAACALMCVENQKLRCRSFNYRKIDRTCFLTNTNEGLTGAIISYHPFDYYELISEKINCSTKFLCPNRKCIEKTQICDGHDDCGDRTDEKNCTSEDFGYSVRLTGSKNKNEGLIEVTAFGKTGFVCDDKFGLNDASVVCKELGYNLGASEVKGNSFFGKSAKNDTPFYMMDDVTCSGNEKRLLDCDFSGWGVHNCLGQEIAGVICKTSTEKCASDYWQCDTGQECLPLAFVCDGLLDCTDGSDEGVQHCETPTEIRLSNGTSQNQGRVEIRHHGTWGTICDDDFNEDAGKVICRQLGYKGSAVVKKDAFFGAGLGPIWLDQVFCSGNETSVEECSHWNWGEHNCDHSEDVGVICSNTNDYEERHSHQVAEVWKPVHYPERCGYRSDNIFNREDDVHFRVVKGSVAKKGDYPWQAAIRVKSKTSTSHWCGAVILSERFILTAAHCLIGYAKGAYIVVAGDYNVDEDEGTEQEAHIEDYYLHEGFRQGHKMNNDIALVKLKGRGFRFNDHIQAICLPDADTSYETEQNCTISGFGSIESGKSAFSHNLRAGWIPLQKREICKMPHVYGDALTEGMICAGSLDEGIDSCDGDSGGPLACLYRGVFTLYGITSWGQHCGFANKPGVYVKVAYYRQWIDDTFKKYS